MGLGGFLVSLGLVLFILSSPHESLATGPVSEILAHIFRFGPSWFNLDLFLLAGTLQMSGWSGVHVRGEDAAYARAGLHTFGPLTLCNVCCSFRKMLGLCFMWGCQRKVTISVKLELWVNKMSWYSHVPNLA